MAQANSNPTRKLKASPTKRPLPATLLDPATFPNAYALSLVGNCLEPTLPDGCAVMFDKSAAISAGILSASGSSPSSSSRALILR